MKKAIVIGLMSLGFAASSFAGDIYLIGNRDSLVTANESDLEVIMALNARHMKQAVREMYSRLRVQGYLFNLQAGDRVEATEYYGNGIVKIEWGNGAYRGYISKDDLTAYLGSRNSPNVNTGIWSNEKSTNDNSVDMAQGPDL